MAVDSGGSASYSRETEKKLRALQAVLMYDVQTVVETIDFSGVQLADCIAGKKLLHSCRRKLRFRNSHQVTEFVQSSIRMSH